MRYPGKDATSPVNSVLGFQPKQYIINININIFLEKNFKFNKFNLFFEIVVKLFLYK